MGNHDWCHPWAEGMASMMNGIGTSAWIGAFVTIGSGITVSDDEIVMLESMLLHDPESHGDLGGTPAVKISERKVRDVPSLLV